MLDRDTCRTHLRKLSGIPFFSNVTDEAFSSWVTALAKSADDAPHAIRAVAALLATRQLPQTPDDILDAIEATREYEQSGAQYTGGYCGRFIDGWTYLSHDPKSPVQDLEKCLFPSRCIGGWIQRTVWRPVIPARIDEAGNPIRQPYDFSGRCKCQPGGWV